MMNLPLPGHSSIDSETKSKSNKLPQAVCISMSHFEMKNSRYSDGKCHGKRESTSCTTYLEGSAFIYQAAVGYHYHFYKRLFKHDIFCRCKNSLEILYRQSKSKKLQNCICDGTEEYPCETIQDNTNILCFGSRSRNRGRHKHKDRHRLTSEGGNNKTDISSPQHKGSSSHNSAEENAIARQQRNKGEVNSNTSGRGNHSDSIHSLQIAYYVFLYLMSSVFVISMPFSQIQFLSSS